VYTYRAASIVESWKANVHTARPPPPPHPHTHLLHSSSSSSSAVSCPELLWLWVDVSESHLEEFNPEFNPEKCFVPRRASSASSPRTAPVRGDRGQDESRFCDDASGLPATQSTHLSSSAFFSTKSCMHRKDSQLHISLIIQSNKATVFSLRVSMPNVITQSATPENQCSPPFPTCSHRVRTRCD